MTGPGDGPVGRPLVARRADISALEAYHSPQLDVPVRLNTNESPYPPPPDFVEAWLESLRVVPLNRYPDRSARVLREAIARQQGTTADRVFCANGSNEVLQTLFLTYGGFGRRAAVFEPTYALHSHIAHITGTEVVVGERRVDFGIDDDAAVALIVETAPHLVLVCSPNNPTGTVEPRETIEALLDVAPGIVVVDEAYGEFADWSAVELVAEDRALVVARTYSKVWSMAALRLGFCVGPRWLIRELEEVVLPYHLAAPTQLAGTVALRFESEMADRVQRLVDGREALASALSELDGLDVFPSGANFILIRPHGRGHRLWELLVERGVLVRDFSEWPRLDDCLRVTVGTAEENGSFLAAMREALPEVIGE
jgi:histidinol-phosphate aminotransferase